MNQQLWSDVDQYFTDALIPADPALEGALAASAEAGLPTISVAPNQGKLLQLLARIQGARSILEIGTLGGYSTIWLARALPDGGRLITLEADPKHAEVAGSNIAAAGLADRVDLRVGPALDTLPKVDAEGAGPFDFIFIDADKASIPDYFDWALKLSRPGTVVVIDNVVRGGGVVQADSQSADVQGIRRLHDQLKSEPRVDATTLQTVGSKGWDGLTIAVINGG
ncbi:O-methyltransferase [Flindersiella endophytica]